jgi:hypothetical protein
LRSKLKKLAALCLLLPALAWAGKPHEHGAAKLDISVEAGKITLQMEAPLDSLLGFERAPRNDAERKNVDELVRQLKAADALFRIDPAARCTLGTVALNSSALKLGQADARAADDDHADLDAAFEFNCKDGAKASFIDVALFDTFKRTRRIEVQVAAPKGQFKRTLAAPARRVALVR